MGRGPNAQATKRYRKQHLEKVLKATDPTKLYQKRDDERNIRRAKRQIVSAKKQATQKFEQAKENSVLGEAYQREDDIIAPKPKAKKPTLKQNTFSALDADQADDEVDQIPDEDIDQIAEEDDEDQALDGYDEGMSGLFGPDGSFQLPGEEGALDDDAPEDLSDESKEKEEKSMKKYSGQVGALQKKDPDFFKFLARQDPGLFQAAEATVERTKKKEEQQDFDPNEEKGLGNEDEAEGEQEVDENGLPLTDILRGEEGDEEDMGDQAVTDDDRLSEAGLEKLDARIRSGEAAALRQLIRVFVKATKKDQEGADTAVNRMLNAHIYNKYIVHCLENMDGYFNRELDINPTTLKFIPVKSRQWRNRIQPLAKVYLGAVIGFLIQLDADDMIAFTLKSVFRLIPYFYSFPTYANKLLDILLESWSKKGKSKAQLWAFLNIRELAIRIPYPFVETVVKKAYLVYLKAANKPHPKSAPSVTFMENGVIELCSLDPVSAYQLGFVFIRQLAVTMKETIAESRTRDSARRVYSWTFLNSLKIWTRVVCECSSKKELHNLAYPLIQLILGTITLRMNGIHLPIRFMCLRLLNHMAKYTGLFIPVLTHILEIYGMQILLRSAKPPLQRPISVPHALRFSEKSITSRTIQDAIFWHTCDILLENLTINGCMIAFPEYVHPVLATLGRFVKESKVPTFVRQVQAMISNIERQSKFVLQHRSKANFSPVDTEKCQLFLAEYITSKQYPLHKYYSNFTEKYQPTLYPTGAAALADDGTFLPADKEEEAADKEEQAPAGDNAEEAEVRGDDLAVEEGEAIELPDGTQLDPYDEDEIAKYVADIDSDEDDPMEINVDAPRGSKAGKGKAVPKANGKAPKVNGKAPKANGKAAAKKPTTKKTKSSTRTDKNSTDIIEDFKLSDLA